MPEPRLVSPKNGDVVLLVGTMKGAFLLRSSVRRVRWDVAGPWFPGHAVYALAYDGRAGRHRIWAGAKSEHWGPGLSWSDDFGHTWVSPDETPIRFPEDTGAELKQVWQLVPGPDADPGALYAGVEPAALFVSRDAGASWTLDRGLWHHPHREKWQPGGGGLCLHTIVPDPAGGRGVTIAVSTGGVYRTDDGASWRAANSGVRAQFLPDPHPEFGHCVHKVVAHPSRPERLFLQNHWGLYRSDDGGTSWTDIANGVPSDFGFCMAMHPHDPETVYIVPIESDMFRATPGGRLRVYRTRDAGASWEPLTKGLPQKDALECVLRDAMDLDPLNPAGVYFGTRSGKLWASANGGASWTLAHPNLPPITCVRAFVVGDPSKVRVPRPAEAATRAGTAPRGMAGRAAAKRGRATRRAGTTRATKRGSTSRRAGAAGATRRAGRGGRPARSDRGAARGRRSR
jgi:hypothetical protein